MTPQAAYDELIKLRKELIVFGSIGSVLGWDQRTYMPAGGSKHRAAQLALVAGMSHEKATHPRIGELLKAVEGSDLLKDPAAAAAVNVREIRREYDREVKLPRALVEELSRTTSEAYDVWVAARKENDFAPFKPWLEKVVKLVREQADCYGWKACRYDALLDGYEPGATTAEITALFGPLQRELTELVAKITHSGKCPPQKILNSEYPVDAQEDFCRETAAALGFDFNSGRLDTTTHPFCSGIGPGDTRLTTRYNPKSFSDAFFGTLHEAGHGIYDQGLDAAHYGTPMGEAVGLGIHESQSRFFENFVGRSRAFWKRMMPRARKFFPRALGRTGLDDLYFAVNDSKPSFIRVESDEATYNLHIILRFEMEQALINGDLKAGDVPGAWNERFRKLLGLKVPDDARGCLQDVHWSGGGIGYFPTYTLGNLYAAQFFHAADRELGGLDEMIAHGDFEPLKKWLNKKIHRQGMRFRSNKLCQEVTGETLSHRFLMDHLNTKFTELYELQ
ncbi:MAG: carboxypeptidase M32 [Planctomycetes bacterium]|nr:carboxypeptidase M32 [Planctomycetota bacterium]